MPPPAWSGNGCVRNIPGYPLLLLARRVGNMSKLMPGIARAQHLTGMLLIAMPNMPDPRFARSVIYLCAHSAEGAMGLVVNQLADNISFPSVVDQLGITPTP